MFNKPMNVYSIYADEEARFHIDDFVFEHGLIATWIGQRYRDRVIYKIRTKKSQEAIHRKLMKLCKHKFYVLSNPQFNLFFVTKIEAI